MSFATAKIVDKFISCDVIHELKNSFDHLFIDTIFDLKMQKKSKRRLKRNWKVLNEKKFKNVIWKQLSKSLLNTSTNRQRIDNYTTTFLQTFKKTTKQFTFWIKFHERTKFEWSQECIDIIKKTWWLKRECRIFDEWQTYVKICDRKNKIITQHKKNDFRATMQTSENCFKKFFKMTKWVKNAKKRIMSQTIISSLKKYEKLITTAQNKIEIMFEIHFSFSSTMFIKNVAEFDYFLSVDDEASMTHREMMKIIHKINLNKTFEINEIINKTLRQLVRVVIEQIRFFFDKCIKKKIQSSHFKKTFIIMLRKSRKKNYSKFSSYKSIALLNTLNKILKLIVFERIRYVVKTLKTFSNIQMSARKQRSMNTILQFITKKIHTI